MKRTLAIALALCLALTTMGSVAVAEELTLDLLKQRAEAAGFKVEALHPMQEPDDETFVAGFAIEHGNTFIPILEWKTEADAQAYADLAKDGEYSLAIRNGRFTSMTDADHGVATDEAQRLAIEGILGAKAAEVAFTLPTVTAWVTSADYAGAFSHMIGMVQVMGDLTARLIAVNNQQHPQGDPLSTDGVISVFFGSMTIPFSGAFTEADTMEQSVTTMVEMLGMKDASVKRNAPNDYTMEMKIGNKNTTVNGVYDPASGAIRCQVLEGKKVTEFFEFVPQGNDTYAMQDQTSRSVVVLKDGVLVSFTHTLLTSKAKEYTLKDDGIYPAATGLDAAWAAKEAPEKYAQYFAFDGKALVIDAKPIGAARVHVEIPCQ